MVMAKITLMSLLFLEAISKETHRSRSHPEATKGARVGDDIVLLLNFVLSTIADFV
jgi:hypothetical protein